MLEWIKKLKFFNITKDIYNEVYDFGESGQGIDKKCNEDEHDGVVCEVDRCYLGV